MTQYSCEFERSSEFTDVLSAPSGLRVPAIPPHKNTHLCTQSMMQRRMV